MADYIPHRGDPLYVWRKVRLYQHHGIVVTKEDIFEKLSAELLPRKLEDSMIIEFG